MHVEHRGAPARRPDPAAQHGGEVDEQPLPGLGDSGGPGARVGDRAARTRRRHRASRAAGTRPGPSGVSGPVEALRDAEAEVDPQVPSAAARRGSG